METYCSEGLDKFFQKTVFKSLGAFVAGWGFLDVTEIGIGRNGMNGFGKLNCSLSARTLFAAGGNKEVGHEFAFQQAKQVIGEMGIFGVA